MRHGGATMISAILASSPPLIDEVNMLRGAFELFSAVDAL
jgi:hypothetical protein